MSTFAVLLVSSYLQIKLLTGFYTKFLKIFYILKLLVVIMLSLQKAKQRSWNLETLIYHSKSQDPCLLLMFFLYLGGK